MKNATKHADDAQVAAQEADQGAQARAASSRRSRCKALVRGAMSYDVPDARAEEAMKAIEKEFVDLNELRVATDLEIQELLGDQLPADRAARRDDHAVAQRHLRARAHAEPRPPEDDQQARRAAVPPRPAGHAPVRRGVRHALRASTATRSRSTSTMLDLPARTTASSKTRRRSTRPRSSSSITQGRGVLRPVLRRAVRDGAADEEEDEGEEEVQMSDANGRSMARLQSAPQLQHS